MIDFFCFCAFLQMTILTAYGIFIFLDVFAAPALCAYGQGLNLF